MYIRCEPSLVSHVCGILAVLLLDDPSERLVELRPHTQGITERLCSNRKHHELLHGQPVTSVGATVDHIKSLCEPQMQDMILWLCCLLNGRIRHICAGTHRHWEDQISVSCQICNVTVQGDTFLCCASFAYSQWYAKNRIGPELSWEKDRQSHTHTAHGSRWKPLVQKHVTAYINRDRARDVTCDAYICCQCRPFQSSCCPARPAPTRWSPDKQTEQCFCMHF